MSNRQLFEKWYSEEMCDSPDFTFWDEMGFYEDMDVQTAYRGWRAGSVHQDANLKLIIEAYDYGQFADDFNQPLAKPIRKAIRDYLCTWFT